MPRSRRGGARQGTPGQAYSNRTDLMTNYSGPASTPSTPASVPSGGTTTPTGAVQASPSTPVGPLTPDMVPNPTDPTMRPNEPVTAGIVNTGFGNTTLPVDTVNEGVRRLRALYAATGDMRLLNMIEFNERYR